MIRNVEYLIKDIRRKLYWIGLHYWCFYLFARTH